MGRLLRFVVSTRSCFASILVVLLLLMVAHSEKLIEHYLAVVLWHTLLDHTVPPGDNISIHIDYQADVDL